MSLAAGGVRAARPAEPVAHAEQRFREAEQGEDGEGPAEGQRRDPDRGDHQGAAGGTTRDPVDDGEPDEGEHHDQGGGEQLRQQADETTCQIGGDERAHEHDGDRTRHRDSREIGPGAHKPAGETSGMGGQPQIADLRHHGHDSGGRRHDEDQKVDHPLHICSAGAGVLLEHRLEQRAQSGLIAFDTAGHERDQCRHGEAAENAGGKDDAPDREPFQRRARLRLAGHQREIGQHVGRQTDARDIGGQQFEAEEHPDGDRRRRGSDQRGNMRPAEADNEDGQGARIEQRERKRAAPWRRSPREERTPRRRRAL